MKTTIIALLLSLAAAPFSRAQTNPPAPSAVDAPLYAQARELYKQGPTKGPEIVRLLREHIASHPDHIEAVSLLGITLFGIQKPDEALPVIERAIALTEQKKAIQPKMLMLRARTLYELNRHWECKRILDVYWAFWQDGAELQKTYDWYYSKVKDAKDPTTEKHSKGTD